MPNIGRIAISLAIAALLTVAVGVPSASSAPQLRLRICHDDGVSKLASLGVRCGTAHRVAARAARKSNCPHRSDFRGCYRTVYVGPWTCDGLFPGEGQDFTCRRGVRWVRSKGGG